MRRFGANSELTVEHLNQYLLRSLAHLEGILPVEPGLDRQHPVKEEVEMLDRVSRLAQAQRPGRVPPGLAEASQLDRSLASQGRSLRSPNHSQASQQLDRSYRSRADLGLSGNLHLESTVSEQQRSALASRRPQAGPAASSRQAGQPEAPQRRPLQVSKEVSIRANRHEVVDAHLISENISPLPQQSQAFTDFRDSRLSEKYFAPPTLDSELRNQHPELGSNSNFIRRLQNINERLKRVTEKEELEAARSDGFGRTSASRDRSWTKAPEQHSPPQAAEPLPTRHSHTFASQPQPANEAHLATRSVRSIPQPAFDFPLRQAPGARPAQLQNITIIENSSASKSQLVDDDPYFGQWKAKYGVREGAPAAQDRESPAFQPAEQPRPAFPSLQQGIPESAEIRKQEISVATCCYDIIILKREVEEVMCDMILTMQSNLYNLYQTFKRKQDANFMTKRDLQFLLSKLGINCSALHSDLLYDILDYGRDGVICFTDFERLVLPKDTNISNVARRAISTGFETLDQFGDKTIQKLRQVFIKFASIAETLHILRREYWRELKALRFDESGDLRRGIQQVCSVYSPKKSTTEDEVSYVRNLLQTC